MRRITWGGGGVSGPTAIEQSQSSCCPRCRRSIFLVVKHALWLFLVGGGAEPASGGGRGRRRGMVVAVRCGVSQQSRSGGGVECCDCGRLPVSPPSLSLLRRQCQCRCRYYSGWVAPGEDQPTTGGGPRHWKHRQHDSDRSSSRAEEPPSDADASSTNKDAFL